MLILGMDFFGYTNVSSMTYCTNIPLEKIEISNGIFDEILISDNIDSELEFDYEWGYDTIFYAKFNGDLLAGNVPFFLSIVDSVIVKRRKIDSFDWIPLFVIPISNTEDFMFERFDMTPASKQEYEYAIVPTINNMEGSYSTSKMKVEFDGMFVVGTEKFFNTSFEAIVSQTGKESKTTVVETMGSRWPFIINNSKADYYSGSASGVFIKMNNCTMDFDGSYKYREELNSFLNDKKYKILKMSDGRIWMISIVNRISETQEADTEKFITNFDFVQVGDVENKKDLYKSGFIDYYIV